MAARSASCRAARRSNFYQVIPLYRDELEYKLAHDADALLDKMNGISFVVESDRQDAITRGTLSNDDFDGEMDDASYHIESIEEKRLPIDPINAYNHMAIYLRWCMEHDLMGEEFLKEYGEVAKQVKADPASVDLRAFIQNELDGCLFSVLFDQKGRAFAGYYYGEGDSPYYPADVDDNALRFFGPERYHSNEFQDEAYLFIPFDEDYYQAMAKVIEERFTNWQGQDFDEDTLEPSELAEALMEYLDCECTYFPSMKDDDPIMSAYSYAKRESVKEGFVPVLIKADDETLLECLVMNADPKNDADIYEFDLKTVTEYRKKMLSTSVKDGKAVLEELTGQRKEEAEDDDMDWDEEILGEMEGGYENNRISCYWDSEHRYDPPSHSGENSGQEPLGDLCLPALRKLERLPRYAGADGSGQILVRAARRGACCHEPRRTGVPAPGPRPQREGRGCSSGAVRFLPGCDRPGAGGRHCGRAGGCAAAVHWSGIWWD